MFERYASRERRVIPVGHSPTRSSRIRSQGSKIACYLNGEADHGRATLIHLPDEADTLGEVLPKIQSLMHLDQKLLYAAELYLPDGKKIEQFKQLVEAGDKGTAIIVACGEPFDPTTVPFDLLEYHLHGGGRTGPKKVFKELSEKRRDAAHRAADSVRASGHGVYPNSAASVTSRSNTVMSNHELAAEMRHEYMEQLMFRHHQQRQLIDTVRQSTSMHKEEHRAARERLLEMERERLITLALEREEAKRMAKEKKEASQARIRQRASKIRQDAKHRDEVRLANSARLQRNAKIAAAAAAEAAAAAPQVATPCARRSSASTSCASGW